MSRDALDPLAGTRYRTLSPLGAGGMGEVFEGEHVALGRRVVVKLLHRRLAARADMVDRMRLEGQALGHVQHPNVVSAIDYGVTLDDRPFLVMELLAGRTLRDELTARGTLPAGDAIAMVRQALEGLGAVHAAGLVHRDVKLDNLFVCDVLPGLGRVVKLLDFGVAKVVNGQRGGPRRLAVSTEEGVAMGTPRFFSPEQAAGDRVDARADVYAMGVVLYALVAGRGPFDHLHDVGDLLDAHISEIPVPPSLHAPHPLPVGLEAVILKALAKRPEDRFATAAEFGEALRRASGTLEPESAAPVLARHRAPRLAPVRPRFSRRIRAVALFFGVLLVSLAASALGTVLAHWALG